MEREGWVSISMLLSCLFIFGYKVEVNVMARHMQLHASIGTGFREQSEWGQSFTLVLGEAMGVRDMEITATIAGLHGEGSGAAAGLGGWAPQK